MRKILASGKFKIYFVWRSVYENIGLRYRWDYLMVMCSIWVGYCSTYLIYAVEKHLLIQMHIRLDTNVKSHILVFIFVSIIYIYNKNKLINYKILYYF